MADEAPVNTGGLGIAPAPAPTPKTPKKEELAPPAKAEAPAEPVKTEAPVTPPPAAPVAEPAATPAPAPTVAPVETPAPVVQEPEAPAQPSEMEILKQRADMMGIGYSNNIGVEALRAKIEAKMNGEPEVPEVVAETPANPLAEASGTPAGEDPNRNLTTNELREKMRKENMRLIRCKITNLNPAKKELQGEIIAVANDLLGTVKKFVPFGEATENGFHIPFWIYKRLKKRRFPHIVTTRNRRTGTMETKVTDVLEFAIEELDPLDREELGRLGLAQQAAGSIESQA